MSDQSSTGYSEIEEARYNAAYSIKTPAESGAEERAWLIVINESSLKGNKGINICLSCGYSDIIWVLDYNGEAVLPVNRIIFTLQSECMKTENTVRFWNTGMLLVWFKHGRLHRSVYVVYYSFAFAYITALKIFLH